MMLEHLECQQEEVRKNLHTWIDRLDIITLVNFCEMDATDDTAVEITIKGHTKPES